MLALRIQGFLVRALEGNSEKCVVKMNVLVGDVQYIITRILLNLTCHAIKDMLVSSSILKFSILFVIVLLDFNYYLHL